MMNKTKLQEIEGIIKKRQLKIKAINKDKELTNIMAVGEWSYPLLVSALLKWHNSKQSELHGMMDALRKKIREQRNRMHSKQLTPDEILNTIDRLSPGPPFAIGTIWTMAQIKIIKRKLKEAMDLKEGK